MRYLLALLLLVSVGCSTLQFDKGIIILTDSSEVVQNGVTYTLWVGMTDTGSEAFGIIRSPKESLQVGDIIVAKALKTDTAWTYVRRLNANR